MGGTPSRDAEKSAHSNYDSALQRAKELKDEYGNGINANIVIQNEIEKGYTVHLVSSAERAGRWHAKPQNTLQYGECASGSFVKRDGAAYGVEFALQFRVTPSDGDVTKVAIFGVGIDVPYENGSRNGIYVQGNVDQSVDLTKFIENACTNKATVHHVVAQGIDCKAYLETSDGFTTSHPLVLIKFVKYK